jgi:hypothetical protein
VCNHPYLIRGCEETDTQGLAHDPERYCKRLVEASGKLVLLDKLLPKIKAAGHKVLIFSQMVRVLDILETYLMHRRYGYERLDGSVRGNDRQAAIDRFCNTSDPNNDRFVFLLCTRAGGVGINLAAANTVIIYDSDWNPQNDIQAQARCHRIGQTQEVKVYRLICANSYERYMFERASRKLGLDQAVLSYMSLTTDSNKQLDNREIDTLLKYGAYALFREDEDKESERVKRFMAEDIDKILERSERVVWNATQKSGTTGSSTFSKATFSIGDTTTNDEQETKETIDFQAPDFWDRILPEEQNVAWLMKRLDDYQHLLNTTEAVQQFLTVLERIVQQVQRLWEEGNGERVKDVHELIKVLQRCITLASQQESGDQCTTPSTSTLFSPAEKLKLMQWYEAIAHPKRRRRQLSHTEAKRSLNEPLPEELAVSSSDDSDTETTTNNNNNNNNNNNPRESEVDSGGWSRAERIRLHQAFFAFGTGVWGTIQAKADLLYRSLSEIYTYTRHFLIRCIRMADEEDKPVFRQCFIELTPPSQEELDSEQQRRRTYTSHNVGVGGSSSSGSGSSNSSSTSRLVTSPLQRPHFRDPVYRKLMKKRLKSWARRLRLLHLLREEVESYEDPYAELTVPGPFKPLTTWWTKEDDRSLLLGTYAHGWGSYLDMLRDRKLTFYSHVPNFERAVMSAITYDTSNRMLALLKYATVTCQTNASIAQPNQPLWLKFKFNLPADMDIEHLLLDLETTPSASITSTSTTTTTTTSSSSSSSSSPSSTATVSSLTTGLTDEWPSPHILDMHVKMLCDQIQRSRKTSARGAERQQRRQEKALQRRALMEAKRRERQNIWSKREEKSLRQAILMFGGGQWTTLKTRAQLVHKSESQIEEYFYNLMALCRQVLSTASHGLEQALSELEKQGSSGKSEAHHSGSGGRSDTTTTTTTTTRLRLSDDSDDTGDESDVENDDENENENDTENSDDDHSSNKLTTHPTTTTTSYSNSSKSFPTYVLRLCLCLCLCDL